MEASPQQYPPAQGLPRVLVAMHIAQEHIPPAGPSSSPHLSNTKAVVGHGGSGYGPPLLERRTPVQQLVENKSKETDLICIPLTNANWRARWEGYCLLPPAESQDWVGIDGQGHDRQLEAEQWRAGGAFKRGEVNVTRGEETSLLLACASEWLELDSPVEGIRFDSELALKQEVTYASHLHISSIILRGPRRRSQLPDYARAINSVLSLGQYIRISIRLPISDLNAYNKDTATWEMWDALRSLCGYNARLDLALDLGYPLPTSPSTLARWSAEPIRQVIIPASTFIPNAKNYPVLSKSCQAFLQSIFKFKPTVILTQTTRGLHQSGGSEAYAQYVHYLERKMPAGNAIEQYASAYMDYLQAPLQPLMDNLETDTYEGFERDPVKYRTYEDATYLALCDRPSSSVITVFVVGAGRGPLVAACLRAAERAGRSIHVTAVEKNPNAFVILQERKALEWGESVDLVLSDMRSFIPTKGRADIIVSELLGSFGDNELSPECLDGVMRHLKSDGVSIPSSYTSYLAPIASSKLHAEVSNGEIKAAEQPYVVMFQSATILSSAGGPKQSPKVAPCWTFDHPRPDVIVGKDGLPITNNHNCRSAHLSFHIAQQSTCHGFAGYFEAVLYRDLTIGIHPERYDPEMLSWFPCFFPLREPLYVPSNSELDVSIFRLTDSGKRRIWFEWMAEVYLNLPTSTAVATLPAPIKGTGAHGRSRSATPSSNAMLPPGSGGPRQTSPVVDRESAKSPRLSSAAFASAPSPNPNQQLNHQQQNSYSNNSTGSSSTRARYLSQSGGHQHHHSVEIGQIGRRRSTSNNSETSGGNTASSAARAALSSSTGTRMASASNEETIVDVIDEESTVRVRIAMTRLHNPGARSSSVSLT